MDQLMDLDYDTIVAHLADPAVQAAAGVSLLVLLATLYMCCGSTSSSSGASASRDMIAFVGPSNGGKTTLLQRWLRGDSVRVETVPSMRTWRAAVELDGEAVPVAEVPGNLDLRRNLKALWPRIRTVAVVVDASAGMAQQREAADMIADLLTTEEFVDAEPPISLVVVASKADVDGAKTPEAIHSTLDKELDRLKTSRRAVARVEAEAEDTDAALLLGIKDETFRLDAHAGCHVSFCAASAAPGGLADLQRALSNAN